MITLEAIDSRLREIDAALQLCRDAATSYPWHANALEANTIFIAAAREGWPQSLRNERRLLRALHDMLYESPRFNWNSYNAAIRVFSDAFTDETAAMEGPK